MNHLTKKQERFAQLYVELGNASEAYRQAYDTSAPAQRVHVEACGLLKHPKVARRVQDLKDELEERALWRRVKSVKVLAEIAEQGEKDSDRVNAVKALNSMHGWDKQTIDHTSSDGSMTPKPAIDASQLSDAALQELINARSSGAE